MGVARHVDGHSNLRKEKESLRCEECCENSQLIQISVSCHCGCFCCGWQAAVVWSCRVSHVSYFQKEGEMKTRAAIVYEPNGRFVIEDVDLETPGPDEVLVEVHGCGVCHTDAVAQQQLIPVPLPAVLGHEGSGIILEVGSHVHNLRVGDHVGFSFGFCGHCERDLAGEPYACENFNAINFGGTMPDGSRPISKDGKRISSFFAQSGFAEHAVVNHNSVVKVDERIELALVGPLGCGIQTGAGAVLNRLKPPFGSTIAVFGCGTVGLSAIMAAKIAGCKEVIAVDLHDNMLNLALELGASKTFNVQRVSNLVEEIKDYTHGGIHYAIDTTGNALSIRNAMASLRFSGTCVILGMTEELSFHVQNELMGEAKTLAGCVEGDANPKLFIPLLLDYYQQGRFPFDKLITLYPFAKINEAFDDSGAGKVAKAVLKMKEPFPGMSVQQ